MSDQPRRTRASRLLGLGPAALPPGDPLRTPPPEPPPEPSAPEPRPAGHVPAGVRQPAPGPADFLGTLLRQSRHYR